MAVPSALSADDLRRIRRRIESLEKPVIAPAADSDAAAFGALRSLVAAAGAPQGLQRRVLLRSSRLRSSLPLPLALFAKLSLASTARPGGRPSTRSWRR